MDADTYYLNLMNYKKATVVIKELLSECIEDMIAHHIPIRPDNVRGIYLGKLSDTRACCYIRYLENGYPSVGIIISDKITKYLEDPIVIKNVKNSIYHELIHTCVNADSHNETFIHWSNVCDNALGTHTRWHMERPIYYNTRKKAPVVYECPKCKATYFATAPREEMICEFCSLEMIRLYRRKPHEGRKKELGDQ